jgi:hypothetical protein
LVSVCKLPLAEPLPLMEPLPLTELPPPLVRVVDDELLLALPLSVSVSTPVPPWGLHPAKANAAPRIINSFFILGQTRVGWHVEQWGEKLPWGRDFAVDDG